MNNSEKKSLRFFGDKKKLLSLPPQIRLGDVAQSVEQRTENPCVGGSIPSITTGKICKPLVLKELGVSFFKGTELGTEKFILIDFLHQNIKRIYSEIHFNCTRKGITITLS